MLSVRIEGVEPLLARLDRLDPALRAAVASTMEREVELLVRHIRSTKFAGRPLRARRGPLSRSLVAAVEATGDGVRGVVRVGGPVARWAGVHEYGGTVRVAGYPRRSGQVNPYSYNARRRAFLAPSLGELRQSIIGDFGRTVAAVVRGEAP